MLQIVHDDESIIIIDKPQGMPTAGGAQSSLCDEVFKQYSYLSKVKGYKEGEGGLLNRLDNDTGGLVLFAKTDESFKYYSNEMNNNKIVKIYTVVVEGCIAEQSGIIDTEIFHDKKNKKKMTVKGSNKKKRGKSQNALTEWKLIKKIKDRSVLEVRITKGKRHQIRVHLASIGHPVYGDKLYGKTSDDSLINNHFLYAGGVVFNNFINNKKTEVMIDARFSGLF